MGFSVRKRSLFLPLFFSFSALVLNSCSGGGGGDGGNPPPPGPTQTHANLAFVPAPYKMSVEMGSSTTQTVTIVNVGDGQASGVNLEYPPVRPLEIVGNTCSNRSLAPRESCSLAVKFTPVDTQEKTQTLSLNYTDVSDNSVHQAQTVLTYQGLPKTTQLVFSTVVKKLSKTVFAGQTASPVFEFTNHSGKSVTIDNVKMAQKDGAFSLIVTNDACNGKTLADGQTCTLQSSFSMNQPGTSSSFTIQLSTKDAQQYTYSQEVAAVTYQPDHLAVRIHAPYANGQKVFAAAIVDGHMIQFDKNHVGTITSDSDTGAKTYSTYAVEVSGGNDTLYLPPNKAGGVVFVSMENPLSDGPHPSVTGADANNANTVWQTFEYFYNTPDPTTGVSPLANINSTNVNQISMPLSLSVVTSGQSAGEGAAVTTPELYDHSSVSLTTILEKIATALGEYADSWGTLVQKKSTDGSLVRVVAPASVLDFFDRPGQFSTAAFTPYIDDVWQYYQSGHVLYVNANPIVAEYYLRKGIHKVANCVLEGRVDPSSQLLKFQVSQGECPIDADSGDFNTETFTKFVAGDFLGAAGGDKYTTWGRNKTYRSIIGEYIVSAQSVGFLPFCSREKFVLSKESFVANKELQYQPQYTCLANYNQYKESVVNQYMVQSAKYFDYYNYGYGDALGADGALYNLDWSRYPITVTIGKIR